MMATDQDLVACLERSLGPLECALLFGSRAGSHARPDSDIDLAVAASRPIDLGALLEARLALMGETGLGVDLVDLRDLSTSTVLLFEAVRHGRVLKDATGRAVSDRESIIMREHEDFRRRRAGIERDAVERIRRHG